ncbi:MAG: hypothetical protein L6Q99_02885 [Planctomycetes bacterium]|nr:hypothetical protein [Planctomycetota bacterium]
MAMEERFQEYFAALDRAGNKDRCYLCCRSPAEVKRFFGFAEDGTPLDAGRYGIEDVVLETLDVMSYRGSRPVCAVCQLNVDALAMLGEKPTLLALLDEMERDREHLWPADDEPA